MKRFLTSTLPLFLAGVLCFALESSTQSSPHTFESSDESFLNPERGLYAHTRIVARTSFAGLRDSGVSLVYAQIYLAEFRERPLTNERLVEISEAFDRIREAGLKAIVRISYSNGTGRPDASLAQVEEHLQQLAPIFRKHQAIIAFFQAGIIGAWGEWHASTNGLDTSEGRRSVMELLLKHVPEDRFIQVRTPMFKRL